MSDDLVYLHHILEAIEKIERYLSGRAYEYFGVDRKVVWDTCQVDLPPLKKLILPLIQA